MEDVCAAMRVPAVDEMSGVSLTSVTPETTFAMLRKYVALSRPVVLRGAAVHWPAVTLWQRRDIVRGIFDTHQKLPATLTPDGFADAYHLPSGRFLEPFEVPMTMGDFFDALDRSCRSDIPCVPYFQAQNGCLDSAFEAMKRDLICEEVCDLGRSLFGVDCEASNVWIGGQRSVTSCHQDWYENLYVVVGGEKHFTLLPPWEAALVPKTPLPSGRWHLKPGVELSAVTTQDWSIEEASEEVPWITTDPPAEKAIDVTVRPGDVLYLPAMWFHKVRQSNGPPGGTGTIAVNFWFDMSFDSPAYHLQRMIKSLKGLEDAQ